MSVPQSSMEPDSLPSSLMAGKKSVSMEPPEYSASPLIGGKSGGGQPKLSSTMVHASYEERKMQLAKSG